MFSKKNVLFASVFFILAMSLNFAWVAAETNHRMNHTAQRAVVRIDNLFFGVEHKLASIDTVKNFCSKNDRLLLEDIIFDSVSIKGISFIKNNKIICSDRSQQQNLDISSELPTNLAQRSDRISYTAYDQRRNKKNLYYLVPYNDMWVRVSLHLAYMDFWISDFGQRNMMKAQVVYGGKFIAGNKNISSRYLINHVEITSKHYPFSVALGYDSALLLQAFNDQILFALMVTSLLTALLLVMLYSYNKTRRTLESEIQQGIKNNEFTGYLQPIVCSNTERWLGAEILLRWEHPINGLTSPAEFLTIAENTGLINEITLTLLAEAGRNKTILDKISTAHYLSLNVTVSMIASPYFVHKLINIIRQFPSLQKGLVLEFTERETFTDDELIQLQSGMTRLRKEGVTWALDDFGCGYSGLSRLQQLSFDILKIDRTFIAASSNAGTTPSILDSICELAKRFKCIVIAEDVETIEQADRIRQLNIECCQGYLFAKPMSVKNYIQQLQAKIVAENII